MRISLFGGPGASKSTTAADQFARMKRAGYSIELVSEYVKSWAVQKRTINNFDQVYLMGKQMQYEYRFLSNGVKNIITDSPVLLSAHYTRALFPGMEKTADAMEAMIAEYDKQFPSINIFLNRGDKPYKTEGRWQTYEEALALDETIRNRLDDSGIDYVEFGYNEGDTIFRYIERLIDR